ncbi:MAG: ABC transporter substrate-binding protein [Flavobacteriales bacterium]
MKRKYTHFRNFSLALSAAVLLASCGGSTDTTKVEKLNQAKGGRVYGGVFKINEVEDYKSLYPLSLTDAPSYRIASQIYEGPMKFDQATLKEGPCLAEEIIANEDATVFTLKIRKGVKFQDDPCFPGGKGREMTADDFKYCLDRVCAFDGDNQLYYTFEDRVKGAREYRASTEQNKPFKEGVEGVKKIDKYTVEIHLNYSFAGFTKLLAHPACFIYPKEAVNKYGRDMRTRAVGTGAFKVKSAKQDYVILERNKNYWEKDEFGNQLPYLNGIKITFHKEKKTELLEFRKKALDMVWKLPVEEIPNILANFDDAKKGGNIDFELQSINSLTIQYYAFLHTSDVFKDKRVRQAFNMAINREDICEFVLQGEGEPATYGFVPPFTGYDYQSVKGFKFNRDEARRLLNEAMGGKKFPEITLQLNSGGSTNKLVAEKIVNMLKENLGVTINLEVLPFPEHMQRFETSKALIWRTAWIADYPSAENFLSLFNGDGVPDDPNARAFPNSARYKNPEYDALLKAANQEIDETKRNSMYAKLDQMLIDDAVVMPIYYDTFLRLLQKNVKNLPINPMEFRDFSKVYFSDEVVKEKVSAADK